MTKKNLGCDPNADFCVPDQVLAYCRRATDAGRAAEERWLRLMDDYRSRYPQEAREFARRLDGQLPEDWRSRLPLFRAADGPLATRAASGIVLNALAEAIPELIGGSADLAPSNKTLIKGAADFQKASYDGRNIRFGVREHAMGAILSGLALHGGLRPYGGTFLVFSDYMRPAIRLAALMKLPVIYVFTHDSIAVGEDGPTHQPVEHLAALRSIPGLTVIRPADAVETGAAWTKALQAVDGPVALVLSRQKLPVLEHTAAAQVNSLGDGAYVVGSASDEAGVDVDLLASGSEVHLALETAERLKGEGISVRVVSFPSWELFDRLPDERRQAIVGAKARLRVVIEAGIAMGWEKYAGNGGRVISIERFGASAPGPTVMTRFGFSPDAVTAKIRSWLESES